MTCAICQIRKARRRCPALGGDICTVCCATGREETIECPLDCEYLRESHRHERLPEIDTSKVPNQDIRVTEEFLRDNQILMAFIAMAAFEGAMETPAATDWDIREAFEALIRGYRAIQSGVYYEPRPDNLYAAGIADHVQEKIAELREREEEEAAGSSSIRDAAILGTLAFMQRLEYSHNNGRKRSRAFIDFLGSFYNPLEDADENVVEPDEPRIIL